MLRQEEIPMREMSAIFGASKFLARHMEIPISLHNRPFIAPFSRQRRRPSILLVL